MGMGRALSVALVGLNGHVIEVEADIGQTLPNFVLLGLPDASLNEARERIRSASQKLRNPLESAQDHGESGASIPAQEGLGF